MAFTLLSALPAGATILRLQRSATRAPYRAALLTKHARAGLMPLKVTYATDHAVAANDVLAGMTTQQKNAVWVPALGGTGGAQRGFDQPGSASLVSAAFAMIDSPLG